MKIPYGKQSISQEDIDAVVDVLNSDWLTQGPMVPKFEKDFIDNFNCNYAVAVNSATSALHIACLALGVTKGDIVWTSANSFVASSNCALYCGADVDFIDIDLETYNICLTDLEDKLVEAKKKGNLPKVLIPVHLTGNPYDLEGIYKLSQEYNFKIIEDASHAIGAHYKGEKIGSCRWSDITVFSFHPVKIITTGEGGVALTNDKALSDKLELFRSHGITRNKNLMTRKGILPPWYYEQLELGFNYRMTDIHAALGIKQLEKIESFLIRRNDIAKSYEKRLSSNSNVILPRVQKDCYSSFHLYVVLLNKKFDQQNHLEIFNALRNKGIGVNLHYMPIYLQPFYKDKGFTEGKCPNAEQYSKRAISLPVFPSLTDLDLDNVFKALEEVL